MSPMPTICLCMIVKNEAAIIARCLDSVLPLLSHWVIVDTGSTDGTQDIIRAHMKGMRGQLYERPWTDFAHNRSEALSLARPHADYSLLIDADDVLELPPGFALGPLMADCYTIDFRDDPTVFRRVFLVNNRLRWFYRGVLHEFVTSDEPHAVSHLEMAMRRTFDGARRKEPDLFKRDADILATALSTEQDPFLRSRYTFYLAQSYRDSGDPEKALHFYLDRAQQGGWIEEVYFSLYQAAKMKELLNHPDQDVIAAFETATRTLPSRVEAAHRASRLCRLKGLHVQGYEIAKRSLGKPFPSGCLFGEAWIYETGLLDEYAVNAFYAGHPDESLDASLKILGLGRLTGDALQRVINNARAAWKGLSAPGRASDIGVRHEAGTTTGALDFLHLGEPIEILDVGAAAIGMKPVYKALLERGWAHLNAFDGDERHVEGIKAAYGHAVTVYGDFLFDGTERTVYLASPESGMTSLLEPQTRALRFFNGFEGFGRIYRTETVQTRRLDDVENLPPIDFLKMDIQGAELTVMTHGTKVLANCLAVQLEVSFINLYKDQPSFGDVDVWMRSHGFAPHRFTEVKRWSIAPTIFENNFRVPGHQLLEADIIYIKDPLALEDLSDSQLQKLAVLSHFCFSSVDLCVHFVSELASRGAIPNTKVAEYRNHLTA